MGSWYESKLFVERALAISNDALHVILGVLVQMVAALVSRRPLSSIVPWLAVLVLTIWNEAVDVWTERWPSAGEQLGEAAKDGLLTLLLPTVLLLAARLRPDLFRRGARSRRK